MASLNPQPGRPPGSEDEVITQALRRSLAVLILLCVVAAAAVWWLQRRPTTSATVLPPIKVPWPTIPVVDHDLPPSGSPTSPERPESASRIATERRGANSCLRHWAAASPASIWTGMGMQTSYSSTERNGQMQPTALPRHPLQPCTGTTPRRASPSVLPTSRPAPAWMSCSMAWVWPAEILTAIPAPTCC